MSDEGPPVQTSEFPGTCPQCGRSPVTLVSLGDPDTARETSVNETKEATVTVTSHYAFLSCSSCGHSWDLPKTSAS